MRRLIPVISFLILASTAFWGILQYAKIQEDLKKQTSVKAQTIKICTDLQSNILDEIGKEFYAETGFQIEIIRMTAEQLGSNGHQGIGEADIFLTSQTNLEELKKNKALRSYSSESTDTALEQFKDFEGTWTGIWLDPIVFVVNKEFAARHSLLNYNWNNIMTSPQIRLSMTDFIAADMAEDLLLSMAEHFGITEALYLLSEGNSHIVQYGKYLSTPSRMAGMGKCDIGISSYNEAMRAQKENLPLQIMYPTDGTSWYLYGIGLSADSKEPELGRKLMNWLLTPTHYKKVMQDNGCYFIYVNDSALPADTNGNPLSYWELEKKYVDERKKILLNEWIEQVRFRRIS